MSSILKALEKVEESRAAQQEGALGRFHKERERRRRWVVPVCILSGALGAGLVTFALMGGFSRLPQAPASVVVHPLPPAPAPAAATVPAPAAAAAPLTVTAPVEPPQAATAGAPPEVPPVAAAMRRSAAPVKRAAGAAKKRPLADKPMTALAAQPQGPGAAPATHQAAVPQAPPEPAQPGAERPATPGIRVTGIAWQKDAGGSVAMVNGRQVYVGETVEGARVSEILPDRVKFQGNAGTFEVPLGAGQ